MQFYAPAERLWKKISYLSGVGERYRGSDTLRWPEPSPQGPYHLLTGRVRGCDSHQFLVHQRLALLRRRWLPLHLPMMKNTAS